MSSSKRAAEYVAAGWRIVRIEPRGKRPLARDWPQLVIGPADLGPADNIGVILGDVSRGLVDIDLDCPEAVALAPLLLPSTRTFGRAGARKSHWIYYAHSATAERFRAPDGTTLVELRANRADGSPGLQTVFPGSVHQGTGEPIDWDGTDEIAEVPAAALHTLVARLALGALLVREGIGQEEAVAICTSETPRRLNGEAAECAARWLGWPAATAPAPAQTMPRPAQSRPAADPLSRARAYLARVPGAVSGDGGHQQTWAVALAAVRGFALSEEDALDLLMSEYNPRCSPPWSERELRHKVASAARGARVATGYLLDARPTPPAAPDAPAVPTADDEWPPCDPFDDDEKPLPPLPTEALPDVLRDWVLAVAEQTQTPPDMAILLTLSACAAAVARRAEVALSNGHREPLNLYTVTVLPPGERKSSVVGLCAAPLEEWERRQIHDTKAEVARAAARVSTMQRRIAALQGAAAKARTDQDRRAVEAEIDDAAEELAKLPTPVTPRLLVDDATPESLMAMLAAHGRIAMLSAEGDVFGMMAGKYSKNANLNVYLKSHSGDSIRVDRIGRPSEYVDAPALTLGLAVQPEILAAAVGGEGMRGSGLLARFLYCAPRSRLGERKITSDPIPETVRARYHQVVQRMLLLQQLKRPITMPLSPGASGLWTSMAAEHEPTLAKLGENDIIRDWAAKYPGAILRLAGILHCVRVFARGDAPAIGDASTWAVDADSMAGAILLGRALIKHTPWAMLWPTGDTTGDTTDDARFLWEWLQKHEIRTASVRDIHQRVKKYQQFRRVAAVSQALGVLARRGLVREIARPTAARPKGGRPASPPYEVRRIAAEPQNQVAV